MDVDLGLVGQIVVEHVRDVVHVDPTAGDVGGDEHVNVPSLEGPQRVGSGRLRLVAMDGIGRDVGRLELSDEPVCAVLGPGEHNGASNVLFDDELNQHPALVGFLEEEHLLADAICGHLFRTDVNGHRIVKHVLHQIIHGLWHGGTEEEVLALLGHQADDAIHVMNEAHVEHPVGLVEHEMLDVTEIDVALLFQVKQTTRRGHEDVDAAAQRIDLWPLSDTAEDDAVTKTKRAAVGLDAVTNLRSKFARRREDEGSNGAPSLDVLRRKMVKDGEGKRRRFPCPRLCHSEHVSALKKGGNGLGLNGRGHRVAFGLYGVEQFVTQAKVLEGRHGFTTCGRNLRGDPSARPTSAARGSPRMKQGGLNGPQTRPFGFRSTSRSLHDTP